MRAIHDEREREALLRVEALETNALWNLDRFRAPDRHWTRTATAAGSSCGSGWARLLARCKAVSSNQGEAGEVLQEPFRKKSAGVGAACSAGSRAGSSSWEASAEIEPLYIKE